MANHAWMSKTSTISAITIFYARGSAENPEKKHCKKTASKQSNKACVLGFLGPVHFFVKGNPIGSSVKLTVKKNILLSLIYRYMSLLYLFISKIYVTQGPTQKRFRPRARGRADRERKRSPFRNSGSSSAMPQTLFGSGEITAS